MDLAAIVDDLAKFAARPVKRACARVWAARPTPREYRLSTKVDSATAMEKISFASPIAVPGMHLTTEKSPVVGLLLDSSFAAMIMAAKRTAFGSAS